MDQPSSVQQQRFKTFISKNILDSNWEAVLLAHQVISSNTNNRWGCRIPVASGWDLEKFDELLQYYHDRDLLEWLRYGFPVSWDDAREDPTPANINHMGATMFPQCIDEYFEKEVRLGATIGPFDIPPFIRRIGISPLSTRPKKDTGSRRIILDLSYPIQASVNDGIDKDWYCGNRINLTYPTIDTLANRIVELYEADSSRPRRRILLWKRDLARYFRQVPLCPRDYSLIGMRWRSCLWFDRMMPMGLRSAAYVAQRISNSITYIHGNYGHWSINYLDDFGSAEYENCAWESFQRMQQILIDIGATESTEKAVEPTTRLEFLGTTVDTIKMTIEVSTERRHELTQELRMWRHKRSATKKQLQSLIGKLSFITNCVRPGRIFISRLLNWLKQMKDNQTMNVPDETMKDIRWWETFLPKYNGVSLLWIKDCLMIDYWLETDACMTAGGAHCDSQYIHFKFPQNVLDNITHIAQLELFTIVVAIKIWSDKLAGKVVRLSSDSQLSVLAVNSGRTKDKFMQKCLRELAWVSCTKQFWLKLQFLPGKLNIISDALSRWYTGAEYRRTFYRITHRSWRRRSVNDKVLTFFCDW